MWGSRIKYTDWTSWLPKARSSICSAPYWITKNKMSKCPRGKKQNGHVTISFLLTNTVSFLLWLCIAILEKAKEKKFYSSNWCQLLSCATVCFSVCVHTAAVDWKYQLISLSKKSHMGSSPPQLHNEDHELDVRSIRQHAAVSLNFTLSTQSFPLTSPRILETLLVYILLVWHYSQGRAHSIPGRN